LRCTFQKPPVFDELTVLENVDIAATFGLAFRSLLRLRKGIRAVSETLNSVNVIEQRDDAAGTLLHGQKLEVAMVLVQRSRLLLLDEPVAGGPEGAPAHRRAHREDRARGHDGARDRARQDLARRFAHTVTVRHEGKVLTGTTAPSAAQRDRARRLPGVRDARGAAEVLAGPASSGRS
jgi:urea transport system ATP-binding protein